MLSARFPKSLLNGTDPEIDSSRGGKKTLLLSPRFFSKKGDSTKPGFSAPKELREATRNLTLLSSAALECHFVSDWRCYVKFSWIHDLKCMNAYMCEECLMGNAPIQLAWMQALSNGFKLRVLSCEHSGVLRYVSLINECIVRLWVQTNECRCNHRQVKAPMSGHLVSQQAHARIFDFCFWFSLVRQCRVLQSWSQRPRFRCKHSVLDCLNRILTASKLQLWVHWES